MKSKTRTFNRNDEYALSLTSKDTTELYALQSFFENQRIPSVATMEKCIAVRAEISRREKLIEAQLAA
jgi:hypothetical protein